MPRALLCFLLFAAFSALRANTEQEIDSADEELRQAFLRADTAALNRLLADNWKVVHVNGRQQTKPQFIESLQSGRAAVTEQAAYLEPASRHLPQRRTSRKSCA